MAICWDLRRYYAALFVKSQIFSGHLFPIGLTFSIVLRAWYNGSTSASQAEDEGSIPFARTKNSTDFASVSLLIYDGGIGQGKESSERRTRQRMQ